MPWLSLFGIAVGLAMDAFAVAIAAGLKIPDLTRRHVFRLAFHFGLFQFMMPVLGWLAGQTIEDYIIRYDHWVAFGLLSFLGGKMIWEAITGHRDETSGDPTRGLLLIGLSLATSMDALAVGLSMAFLGISIWLPSLVIGVVAAALTFVGIRFGRRIGARWEHVAETFGGIILLAIGASTLLSHFRH